MRNNKQILIQFTVSILLFAACCSKENLVDITNQDIVFLDKTSGKNIFFGADSLYNKDSIFISYDNAINFERINTIYESTDSSIQIDFKNLNTCLLKFSNNDIDTFKLTYSDVTEKTSKGQCKLSASVLKTIQFNNASAITSNYSSAITIFK